MVRIRENRVSRFGTKGTRGTGLDVCSGMVGGQHWLILVVAPLRLRLLRILPRIVWRELMVLTAVMCCENGFVAQGMDGGLTASRAPQCPNVCTDGSLVSDHLAGIAAAGAGVFAHVSGLVGFVVGGRIWTCYSVMLSLELSGVACTLLCLGL